MADLFIIAGALGVSDTPGFVVVRGEALISTTTERIFWAAEVPFGTDGAGLNLLIAQAVVTAAEAAGHKDVALDTKALLAGGLASV